MHMLVTENTANNTKYIVQELHTLFYKLSMELHVMKLHQKFHYKAFHFHQYFHYILQLIYQLSFFYTYNFYNINILQLTITRIPNKSFITHSFVN